MKINKLYTLAQTKHRNTIIFLFTPHILYSLTGNFLLGNTISSVFRLLSRDLSGRESLSGGHQVTQNSTKTSPHSTHFLFLDREFPAGD